ncbi:MAG: FecCD family ABC transporter permease [Candidatus Sumerlaeaceae bacterium]
MAICAPLAGGGISLRKAMATAPWQELDSPDALIFWATRVPRVLAALLTGGALALAGLAYQCVLRNPLAEPYILGVSAGAGMGKALVVLFWGSMVSILGVFSSIVFCFLGALVPLLFLQGLALRQRRFAPVTLLLAGVMLNVVLSAAMMLVLVFAPPDSARQVQLWWLGSLDLVGFRQFYMTCPVVLFAAGVIVLRGRAMNVLGFDSATAAQLGLDVEREVRVLLWSATLLASAVVALAGPIGFIGLVVPHLLRRVFGVDNRLLAPLCLFYGAAFLMLCDLIGWRGASVLGLSSTMEVPVGVVTALLGGPLFLLLLVRGTLSGEIRG